MDVSGHFAGLGGEERFREESPELMSETEGWLAEAAGSMQDSVPSTSTQRQTAEEENDQLWDDWALDESTPILRVRPPDVKDFSYQDDDLADDPFILNSQNMQLLFRPFTFKLDSLTDVSQLSPYLPQTSSTSKKRKRDAIAVGSNSARESSNKGTGVMTYPLTRQQLKIVKRCWRQTTLMFTHLPTHDQIIKLVALSAQVTIPYYGHKFFPNVRRVIYKSDVLLQSISQRYSKDQASPAPDTAHPISFALDWLIDRFDACIHHPSAGMREQQITHLAQKTKYEEPLELAEAMSIAEQRWLDLDSTDHLLNPTLTPGLERMTFHGVQSGTKLVFNRGVEVDIHFGLHSATFSTGRQETLDSIVASSLGRSPIPFRQEESVRLYSFENLASHKRFGPKAQAQIRQEEISRELRQALKKTIIKQVTKASWRQGRAAIEDVDQRVQSSGRTEVTGACRTCGVECDESTCTEHIVA